MKKNYTLNNGYAFLAVEMGLQGDWSRDVDLQKCISRISKRPTFITLYYAHDTTSVSAFGGLDFSFEHNSPICMGVYQVKETVYGGLLFTLKGLDLKMSKEILDEPYENNKEFIDKYNEDNKQ